MATRPTVPVDRVLSFAGAVHRFCAGKCYVRQDAEDLAQEILLELLKGIKSGVVDENFEAWVWTVARNRYARMVDRVVGRPGRAVADLSSYADAGAENQEEAVINEDERHRVVTELSRLSELYREIVRMFYLEGKRQSEIAEALGIPVGTVKRRLMEGRQKLKERMDVMTENNRGVLKRIDLAMACNGSLDPSKYLGRQIRRAILMATYEQPRTIDELSRDIEVPSVIVEDEMAELLYGEAISKKRNRYAANCIVLRRNDGSRIVDALYPFVERFSGSLKPQLSDLEGEIREIGFHGHDFDWEHLLWTLIPLAVRELTSQGRARHDCLKTPPYPQRKDGGYGWFNISERSDTSGFGAGQNSFYTDKWGLRINYYWMGKYFGGSLNSILGQVGCNPGYPEVIRSVLNGNATESDSDEFLFLVENGIVRKDSKRYELQTLAFTSDQFEALNRTLSSFSEELLGDMEQLALEIWEGFRRVVPERLWDQIGGNLGGYLHKIIGMVSEGYVEEGLLESPYIGELPYKQVLFVVSDPAVE